MNEELTNIISKRVKSLFFMLMLIVLISLQAGSAYGRARKDSPFYPEIHSTPTPKFKNYSVPLSSKATSLLFPITKKTAILCGVNMKDSVVGYAKSSTNNQIFYLL